MNDDQKPMLVTFNFIWSCLIFGILIFSSGDKCLASYSNLQTTQVQDSLLKSAYETGLNEEKEGQWKSALVTWGTALHSQEIQKAIEMRMAIEYIQTVTTHNDSAHFAVAGEYYMNAFRQASWNRDPKSIKQELSRLIPLIPYKEQKKWKKEIKKQDPDIFNKVVMFWEMQDPITSTSLNERLIEHWQRIAFAREHFTRARNTVYKTDDRGLIYVRFGKPDIEEKNVVLPPNLIEDPVTGGPLRINGMMFRPMVPIIVETDLWKYSFSNRQEPSFYLFGTNQKGGGFGLQKGIMHMIPSNGYTLLTAGIRRDGGALMLKYSIIGKLRGVTGYYETLYNELTNAFIIRSVNQNISGGAVYQAPDILHRFENQEFVESNRRDRESPGFTTDFVTEENRLPVEYKYFRFLNNKNETEYLLVIDPNLKKLDQRLQSGTLKKHPIKDIRLKSSLISINANGQRKVYASHDLNFSKIIHDGGNVSYFFNSDSVGRSPITGIDIFGDDGKRIGKVTFPMTLFKKERRDTIIYNGVQPIFSSGPLQPALPEELKWKMDGILLSDPILGYQQPIDSLKRIPFEPTLYPTFMNGNEILVFFEVYNRVINNYSITFSYEKYTNGLFGKTRKQYNENANVTAIFMRENNREPKWIYLKLNGFEPGSYTLKLTFKDDKGKIRDTRAVNFAIREAPKLE